MGRRFSASLFVLGLMGCATANPESLQQDGSLQDSHTPHDGTASQWLSVSELHRGGGAIVEKVTYRSDGLTIVGQVCRPDAAGRFPVIMRNHGGFEGLADEWNDDFCRNGAANGIVVAGSSYRGEDGSEGSIEVCLGEVQDVRAMMAVLKTQPYVDADRFSSWGASHGGCVSLELARQQPSLKAVVAWVAPVDMAMLFRFWAAQLQNGEPPPCPAGQQDVCRAVHVSLISRLVQATGGPPEDFSEAYAQRSPALRADDIEVPLMLLYGGADYLVNVEQGCMIRSALTDAGRAPQAWYFDQDRQLDASASVCGGGFLSTEPPASGNAWLDHASYFLLYEGEGHGFSPLGYAHAFTHASSFLMSRL